MKGVVISAVIAVLLVIGSIAYTSHIERVSEELGDINEKVIEALVSENFDTASQYVSELIEYLDSHHAVLGATGNHEDFDKIEMNISELTEYIDGREKTDALSNCRVLDFLFEHLPKNYEMKLENIL